jgi:hypothetical protein
MVLELPKHYTSDQRDACNFERKAHFTGLVVFKKNPVYRELVFKKNPIYREQKKCSTGL